MLEAILDHAKDDKAVEQKNQWIVSKRGRRSMSKTTVGWKFRFKKKNGTVTWSSFKDLGIKSGRRCSVCDIERHPDETALFMVGPLDLKEEGHYHSKHQLSCEEINAQVWH